MFTIHPFKAARMPAVNKGQIFTYLTDLDVHLPIPMVPYVLVEDEGDTVILVDTGVNPDHYDVDRGITGGRPEQHHEALDDLGLTVDDVDYVVMTHLHNDHVGHMALYPDAEFLIQRTELEAVRDPLPHMAFAYPDDPDELLDGLDITVVDGGYRLCPGIELLHTPGHTEGHQSVIVETAEGRHAVVTDLVYCQHNLDPSLSTITDVDGNEVAVTASDQSYIPPGLHVDTRECYRSIERVRERVGDGELLGGHDSAVLGHTYPDSS